LCNRTRIEGVSFFRYRIDGIADQAEGWLFREWIHPEAGRVGDEQHV
jgi:hypothetical protein